MFDVPQICFDRYNTREMSSQLQDEGYETIEVGQGYADMNAPCKKLIELVMHGKIRHGNHPILRWNASCLSTEENNDLLKFAKPERQKDSSRIDGMQAAADGMFMAMRYSDNPMPAIEVWG